MKGLSERSARENGWVQGTTLIELVFVLAIASVVATIGILSFRERQEGLTCKQTAQGILRMFREARSLAIASNREHRVEIDVLNQRYGARKGNRAQNTQWKTVPPVHAWVQCNHPALLGSNVASIQFNPNGTANGGTITVKDALGSRKYEIIVHRTGRVRVK